MQAFELLCANYRSDSFSRIVYKWRRRIRSVAAQIAPILSITTEDATQEILTVMWDAYVTYQKTQARYQGGIWDVVAKLDNGGVQLRHPKTAELLQVPQDQAPVIDKKMSAASFVYLKLQQWKSNRMTLHFTRKNGYAPDPARAVTLPSGRVKQHFVRVVFNANSSDLADDDNDEVGFIEHDLTPEGRVHFSEMIRDTFDRLDPQSRLVLGVLTSSDLPLPALPSAGRDADYVAHVLGLSHAQVIRSLKTIARALPKEVRSFQSVTYRRTKAGRSLVRSNPVLQFLES